MRLSLILLILALATELRAQSDYPRYYLLAHKARTAMDSRNGDSAWKLYSEAFALVDTPLSKELREARRAAQLIRKQSPARFETIAFQARIYDSIADEQEKGYDHSYSAFIQELIREDQRVRTKRYSRAMHAWKTCLKDPQCDRSSASFLKNQHLGLEWRKVDSINIHRLLAKMEQSGFPSSRRVGALSSIAASMLLVHYDRDSLNEVLGPVITAALANGEILPEFYAQIVDRRLRGGQGKDPYYYQIPVADVMSDPDKLKEVDRRRASVGLPPMAETFIFSSSGARSK